MNKGKLIKQYPRKEITNKQRKTIKRKPTI
jgi:hypothetical protein